MGMNRAMAGLVTNPCSKFPRIRELPMPPTMPMREPGEAGLGLGPEGVVGFHVLRQTAGQLIVAFGGFAHAVHHVVDSDVAHEAADRVDYGHCHEVVFLEVDCHVVERGVGLYGDGVGLHHVFDFGDGGVGYELFEREGAAEAVVVVDDVDVVDLVHVLGLHSQLLDAFGHAPVSR